MENLKLIFRLYFSPTSAMSDLMDKGSWLIAAGAVLVVSIIFFGTINSKLDAAYGGSHSITVEIPETPAVDPVQTAGGAEEQRNNRPKIPVIGDSFFSFFSFDPTTFYMPLALMSMFYVPAMVLLMSVFGGVGRFGLVLKRDYGTLAVCTLSAWTAAHLPFALIGILLYTQSSAPTIYLSIWAASGLVFGVFMIFALRTVFGAGYGTAAVAVTVGWLSLSLGMYVMHYVGPWLFSPFLLFFVILHLGGFLGGEMRGFGNAFRQKQNLKRFLSNATVNPNDADAHVQLGMIYLQRRQEAKALEHLNRAFEIDPQEIDANYELGKIARSKGELQTALDHFAVVLEQNDKHATSEIWREVGATYLSANMLTEARDALEKFTERRTADVEGLYYLGKVLKAQGETERASELFKEAIENARLTPNYRHTNTRYWSKLAQKEL